jgi:uncharacterized protein (DUF2336 family)
MTDIIGRLLDEAEKAQRKGHLLLAAVCCDASDQLGLITEERDRLREALCGLLEVEGWSPDHPRYLAARATFEKNRT